MEGKQEDRHRIRTLIVVVSALVLIPAAAIANGKAMWNLATFAGWDDFTAVLLPLSLDGLAALSVYMWRKGRTHSARTFGRATTMLAMVASVIVAALGHMVTADMLVATVLLVVSVGAIPALCLVAFIELLVLDADVQVGRKAKRKTAPKPETKTEPKPEPKPAPQPETVPAPVPTPKPETLTVVQNESIPATEERIRQAFEAGVRGHENIIQYSRDTWGVGMSKGKIGPVLRELAS